MATDNEINTNPAYGSKKNHSNEPYLPIGRFDSYIKRKEDKAKYSRTVK